MNHLVSAELLKLRTTRTTVGLALAGIGIAALLGIANASIAGEPGTADLGSAAFVGDGAWVLVVETVADTVTGGTLGDWLPGVAAATLAGAGERSLLAAGAVVLAWVGAIAAVTVPLVDRRDVE